MILQHGQQDDVGSCNGQRGVGAIGERLHGPTDRYRPFAIDGSVVAAGTLQLDLNLARELLTAERKPRGGRVLAHWYSRRRVSDVQGFRRGGRGRSQGGGCRGSIVGWDLRLRCWRTDVHI
jgi:hypothetical protein